MYKKIEAFCKELENESELIPPKRKEQLLSLRNYISQKIAADEIPQLVVICTHNSRRSHIGQIWLAVAADYFQVSSIQTFSGGTEATAFNIRAVKAFKRAGFEVETNTPQASNPIYQVTWKEEMNPYAAFSKRYENVANPKEKFAAIMVCTSADKGCPIVQGTDFRLSLPYDDPKAFDATPQEEEKYDERVRQTGREIIFTQAQIEK